MSNNITSFEDFYNWLKDIDNQDFSEKSILLIGAGNIAHHYAEAISKLGVQNTSIISKSDTRLNSLCSKFNFRGFSGGYDENLPRMELFDLVIVGTPIPLLLPSSISAISHGQKNILIEKPGALYKNDLADFQKITKDIQVRIAYNRLVYPNFIKLKSILDTEKISSCRFTITERSNQIASLKKEPDILQRWGISNTLHILSMVSNLVGLPEKLSSFTSGELPWHKSGSKFVGGGISKKRVPFSYHGDWESVGGWGIEIYTDENAYKLQPLESLSYLTKSGTWESVPFECAFPGLKFGIAEQIAIMLSEKHDFVVVSLVNSILNGIFEILSF